MTLSPRSSPRPLAIYPHLHRSSQCGSCPTVTPGDICFNCGRVCALLVTPRPPLEPIDHCTPASQGPAPAHKKPLLQNKPFVSQFDRVQALVLAQETATATCAVQRAFDGQLSEVEDLLDANAKLGDIQSLAADDVTLVTDRSTRRTSCSRSCCRRKNTFWSGTSTGSDIFDEDGQIYNHVVERWLERKERPRGSDAKLTRRGVDCRLNLGGRVCEWVIFL